MEPPFARRWEAVASLASAAVLAVFLVVAIVRPNAVFWPRAFCCERGTAYWLLVPLSIAPAGIAMLVLAAIGGRMTRREDPSSTRALSLRALTTLTAAGGLRAAWRLARHGSAGE